MVKTNQKAEGRDLDKVEVNGLWPIQLLTHTKCTDGLRHGNPTTEILLMLSSFPS